MSAPTPPRTGWVWPVWAAVATAAALGLGFLYLARPAAGELGAVRVVVADEAGGAGRDLHIYVAEAPFPQKDTVSPGPAYTGIVHYPVPYRLKPNLKLTYGKRPYEVTAETETGFTWMARPLSDDVREEARTGAATVEAMLGNSLAIIAAQGRLKPGLVFEDFSWEARGLRAPASALPPRPFEQKGSFHTATGLESVVHFPIPYASPPEVELGGSRKHAVVVSECTAKSFKWKNFGTNPTFDNGDVTWTARGVLSAADRKD
jgi:hypothetical protein